MGRTQHPKPGQSPEPEGDVEIIDTEYDIGQDNIEGSVGPFGFGHPTTPVFAIKSADSSWPSWPTRCLRPDRRPNSSAGCAPPLTPTFDWFFLSAANIFVIFCLVLIVLPVGKAAAGRRRMRRRTIPTPAWFACCLPRAWGSG